MLWFSKIRAFLLHLGISLALAGLAAVLVFGVWFPYPFRELSGGRDLFLLITAVDVVLGPLMTFVVFNPAKPQCEKWLDLGVIGALQLAALLYGLWSVAQARPVYVVFEYDRLRVVHAVEVSTESLNKAPPSLQNLPWLGPGYLSLRPLTAKEQMHMTLAALQGADLSARPQLWQPYAAGRDAIRKVARPASELADRFPPQRSDIERVLADAGRPLAQLIYLPVVSRNSLFWTAILDHEDTRVLVYLPLDTF